MLTLSGIRKSYGDRVLFADVSLQVNRGDRVGLVGANGSGKSTLFRLILGEEVVDQGELNLFRGRTVGYLPQESAPGGDETVLELAVAMTPEFLELWRAINQAELDPEADPARLPELRRKFEEQDGHRMVARARQILNGLGFRDRDAARPAQTLSGGWVMRAHLARLLVQEPDLLLLDEPTNHLDLEALLWFQDHLKSYRGGILVISHDREFLNQLVGSVVEIRQSRLFRYRGNYESFLEQRKATEEQLVAAYKNQQREIARLQAFVDRFRAKNTKASQAQSKLKQIERMEVLEAPQTSEAQLGFRFPQAARSGHRVLQMRGVEFAYGREVVYKHLDLEVERGQRIVLVGPNGAGKSTLLKLLAGVLEPQAGERSLGYHVKPGYFSQYRSEILNEEGTVLEEALNTPRALTEETARTVLGTFLFKGDDVFKPVRVLSGGEKSRLALVKLLLDPPNLMLLDEPTTHLDIPSTEALLQALRQYQGTLVFISHDVFFIRHLANQVLHIQDGRLTPYPGDYDYYVEKTGRRPDSALPSLAGSVPAETTPERPTRGQERREQKRIEAEQRQRLARQRRTLESEVSRLEETISQLEVRQAELTQAMEDPSTYASVDRTIEINREYQEASNQLTQLHAEWEEVATQLTRLQV